MKKQLAILLLSTAMLTGCHHLCEECAGGKCSTSAIAAEDVTHQMVLNKTSHFAFDSAVLSDEAKEELKPLIKRLRQNSHEKVLVQGYTDITGPAAYNIDLSERRAKAVKEYLVSKGICTLRIETKGYGATNFVATNETAAGRAKNRRTEIVCHK